MSKRDDQKNEWHGRVGQAIKRLRTAGNPDSGIPPMTMDELARKVGTTSSRISAWEQGIQPPPLDAVVKIAHEFDSLTDAILVDI